MTIYKPEDFEDPGSIIKLCVPAGIGDISWVYSKIKHLRAKLNREVILYVAGQDLPHRGGDLVELLPEVRFGGYLTDRNSFNVIAQSIPSEWPDTVGGLGFLVKPDVLNVSANIHLELGRPLREWLPLLPVDYHYELSIPDDQVQKAASIMDDAGKPSIAIYLSNRDKEKQIHGGWNLWNSDQWSNFLLSFAEFPECKGATFVFLGADYDRDKTEQVSDCIRQAGHNVKEVIGQPLGVALECLKRCHYCIAYPSGIGILANVLNVPGIMFLPWILAGLEKSYADPTDLGYNKYKVWVDPKPDQVLDWLQRIGVPQSFHWIH